MIVSSERPLINLRPIGVFFFPPLFCELAGPALPSAFLPATSFRVQNAELAHAPRSCAHRIIHHLLPSHHHKTMLPDAHQRQDSPRAALIGARSAPSPGVTWTEVHTEDAVRVKTLSVVVARPRTLADEPCKNCPGMWRIPSTGMGSTRWTHSLFIGHSSRSYCMALRVPETRGKTDTRRVGGIFRQPMAGCRAKESVA